MILNSGNPAWPHTLKPVPEYPALDQALECDCLVVGGGMSGAILAYKLTEQRIDTILIDKRKIGGGSSAANTGLLQYSNDKTLTSMIHTFGEDIAVTFYQYCEQSVYQLKELCSKLSASPEFIPRSSLYFASNENDAEMLQKEYQTLRKYGFKVDYWNQATIAKKVVFTMGYETQDMKKDRNAVINISYAILTNPVEDFLDWHERCLIWETARPYLYMRTTPDNRIIAGGLDEAPPPAEKREGRILHQSEVLLNEIRKLFPRYSRLETDYAWASIFGTTHDGMPMIGTHPGYPNCYFIEAYGGNGTVCCMVAANLLTDELRGRPRPELNMFSLQRSSKPSPSNSLTIH
ncbi:FAD-binding oxidoreductase [Paenibacillus sp. KQZ6P-2]|uniref:FAD-binding oxidoreductase n=1 Tax=Paenibacillus mangrovi TaxID=2931978 RepID=A0A9X2B604_9BACL|nr:FAD-dependent oxidoreductase [Paenibacillus mangrovi]MCJ8013337.1 FAD-binding oxidoreductase [Paenibacillus mangrovi]